MIPRYSRPEMSKIWSDENKFQTWLDVEIAACEANAKLGLIPQVAVQVIKNKAKFSVERIKEIEATTNHDVIAFTTNLAENIGEESRYVHFGLTSSDVVDTALCIQLKESSQLLITDLEILIETVRKKALNNKNTLCVGRTHGIHAEPMTFGAKLLMWYAELKRDLERMEKAVKLLALVNYLVQLVFLATSIPELKNTSALTWDLKPPRFQPRFYKETAMLNL